MFWLKLARWVLNHINEKDLIKNTDIDNEIINKIIEVIDVEIKRRKEK